jgi:hypothetical protein
MWSHQQYVKKTQGRRRFNAETVRSEARQAAREYALQTKGTAHLRTFMNLSPNHHVTPPTSFTQ